MREINLFCFGFGRSTSTKCDTGAKYGKCQQSSFLEVIRGFLRGSNHMILNKITNSKIRESVVVTKRSCAHIHQIHQISRQARADPSSTSTTDCHPFGLMGSRDDTTAESCGRGRRLAPSAGLPTFDGNTAIYHWSRKLPESLRMLLQLKGKTS